MGVTMTEPKHVIREVSIEYDRIMDDAVPVLGAAIVEEIRPGWPVDTGRSVIGLGSRWSRAAAGWVVEVTNVQADH